MKNKIIVWALYDDGNMCYYKTLNEDLELEVFPVGINNIRDIKNYRKIDLSLNNVNLLNDLEVLPKPDIVIASPPCESWSRADCSCAIWEIINDEKWIVHNKKYYDNKETTKNKKRDFIKKEINRVIGEGTAGAVKLIIDYFEPKVWIIENPEQSYIWKFLQYHHSLYGIMNSTYYSNYDEHFSLKPTIFFSNINLDLKKDKSIIGQSGFLTYGDYNQRSSIPEKLIKEIIAKAVEKIKYGFNVLETFFNRKEL